MRLYIDDRLGRPVASQIGPEAIGGQVQGQVRAGPFPSWVVLMLDEVDRGLLYILWKIDKTFIFKVHLAQLAAANMFNILR